MNPSQTSLRNAAPRRGLHPLIATAAVSVIVLCAVAVAAMLGWLPGTSADTAPALAEREDAQQTAPEPAPEARTGTAGPQQAPAPAVGAKPRQQAQVSQPAPPSAAPAQCATCGTVESVRAVQVPAQSSGSNIVGTVAGGVVGGVVGNQFGGGSGRDALTVLGAVGGALAGHEIERNIRSQQTVTRHELTVRMSDGSRRVFRSAQPFPYASGDPVRVENDQVLPR